MNVAEWEMKLRRDLVGLDARKTAAMAEAGEIVKEAAKANIGHLQPQKGIWGAWKPLAPATIKDKQRLGYDFNADHNPLERTGKTRESIEMQFSKDGFIVGSRSLILLYQVHGTSRIPPRPVIRPALYTSLPAIGKIVGRILIGEAKENA